MKTGTDRKDDEYKRASTTRRIKYALLTLYGFKVNGKNTNYEHTEYAYNDIESKLRRA